MPVHEFSTGDGAMAILGSLALVVALLGATGGFAADSGATGEPCVGCAGCESGECDGDGENPFASHHHCCTTCCLSHAPAALSIAQAIPASVTVGPMVARMAVAAAGRSPETPYRPPRV